MPDGIPLSEVENSQYMGGVGSDEMPNANPPLLTPKKGNTIRSGLRLAKLYAIKSRVLKWKTYVKCIYKHCNMHYLYKQKCVRYSHAYCGFSPKQWGSLL